MGILKECIFYSLIKRTTVNNTSIERQEQLVTTINNNFLLHKAIKEPEKNFNFIKYFIEMGADVFYLKDKETNRTVLENLIHLKLFSIIELLADNPKTKEFMKISPLPQLVCFK